MGGYWYKILKMGVMIREFAQKFFGATFTRSHFPEMLIAVPRFFWIRSGNAAIVTGMLLFVTGIPFTMGFVGKFYMLASGVNTQFEC
jgi:NADH:ubiquinone oxidoreductase subunit 2 (subunit N)